MIMTRNELERLTITPPEEEIFWEVKRRFDGMAKPLDSLGEFETILAKIGAISGSPDIDIAKKAVIVMCADNGVTEEGISQSGQEVTRLVAKKMGRGESSVGKMAKKTGVDVIPVDIGICSEERIEGLRQKKIAQGTRNFRTGPAMSEEEMLAAISCGIELAEECRDQGYRLLGTGEMGIGNTTTSSAVAAALLGCTAEDVTGYGAGLSKEGFERKKKVIEEALQNYRFQKEDAFRILQTVGGLDLAGLAGVIIGGAMYHIPVVLDGVISGAAALAAERMVPGVRQFLIASHQSKEPVAGKILDALSLRPVLYAGLALGEGTGAVMMFSLLDIAADYYQNGLKFSDMHITPYNRFT